MKLILIYLLAIMQWPVLAASETKDDWIDPEVIKRIDEMGLYLRGLREFKIKSNSTIDVVLKNGQKIEFGAQIIYKAKAPDNLYVEIKSDEKRREYFFNKGELTVFAPGVKFYGVIPTGDTIQEFIDEAQDTGLEMPLADLFQWGAPEAKKQKITSALFIETVKVGKKNMDHFAVRQGKVDWQMWIPQGKKPLPYKIIYVSNNEPERPQFSMILKWDTDPDFDKSDFKFKPPKDSYKIDFKE